MVVSIERAQGAAAAGDAEWAATQSQTAGNFAAQLAEFLEKDPALRQGVRDALQHAGIPNSVITADEVRSFQAFVAVNGLPSDVEGLNLAKGVFPAK
jgi:hypothetical protein